MAEDIAGLILTLSKIDATVKHAIPIAIVIQEDIGIASATGMDLLGPDSQVGRKVMLEMFVASMSLRRVVLALTNAQKEVSTAIDRLTGL